jgi:hypothetical protein
MFVDIKVFWDVVMCEEVTDVSIFSVMQSILDPAEARH